MLTPLPGGPINHHWTKDLALSPDGRFLYVSVGSNSNAAERGLEAEKGRASIWQVDRETGAARVYASGLRNPNGLTVHPETGALWTVVNERDELGPNLVPDYLTSVREGAFYGWPWSYYGDHVDERVHPPRPDMVKKAVKPDYALSSHVAALGLAFSNDSAMPAPYANGAFVGMHGSWNRDTFNGYKMVYIPFENGRPADKAQDVVTGFLVGDKARGRPVGVAIDGTGALLIADDAGNAVWRVAAADGWVTPEPITSLQVQAAQRSARRLLRPHRRPEPTPSRFPERRSRYRRSRALLRLRRCRSRRQSCRIAPCGTPTQQRRSLRPSGHEIMVPEAGTIAANNIRHVVLAEETQAPLAAEKTYCLWKFVLRARNISLRPRVGACAVPREPSTAMLLRGAKMSLRRVRRCSSS